MPDWMWDFTKVNGVIYGVPQYQLMFQQVQAIETQDVLAQKYNLDWDAIQAAAWSTDMGVSEELWTILTDYLEQLKNGGDLSLGYEALRDGLPLLKGRLLIYSGANYLSSTRVDPYKIENAYYTEDFKNYCAKMREWYEAGYITPDILTANSFSDDQRYTLFVGPFNFVTEYVNSQRDDSKRMGWRHIDNGFYNVHRRISSVYGEGYGLTIESGVGTGTCVTIIMK